ncbi:MAG: hypothetical protein GY711_09045 [bacterium]|nr:hypothetical protein [bacterium]
MPATLDLIGLDKVPFNRFVRREIEAALAPLVATRDLRIDFDGRSKSVWSIQFLRDAKFAQMKCWVRGAPFGFNGLVSVNVMERVNYCEDVEVGSTCRLRYRRRENELGRVIASTALHEIGHMFGLTDASSYKGADSAGHTGDPRNPMLDYPNHKDYRKYTKDGRLAKLRVIQKDDTLSGIASQIGFRGNVGSVRDLLKLRADGGPTNEERIRSKDPDVIHPGEKILVPDVDARVAWFRLLESYEKRYTKAQIDRMRRFLRSP